MAEEDQKTWFETIKAFCESLTGGYAPWWVVPIAAVVILAIVF